jgi:O-antigen/teichoic acid export membrane protein
MAALLLLHQLTVTNVVYLQLSLAYITLLVAVLMLWKNDVHLTPAACDPAIAEKLLAFGGKAYVGGITGIFHQRLDQVLLAAFFPAAELGLYSVAVSSSSAIDTIGFAFRTVAAPQIAQHAKIPDKFRELRQTFTKFAVTAGSGAALLALVFPILIPFVYGRPFRGSVTCAELLLLAQLLYTTKSLLTSAAEAFGDSWLGSKAELLGFVPTTVFLVSLLPKFGIVGAALAVLGGCSIQLSVMMAGFSRMKKSFAGARLSARQGK